MRKRCFITAIFVLFVICSFSSNIFAQGELYDDFSGTYINSEQWKYREIVREVVGGELVSKLGNPASGQFRDGIHFQNPESISSIECEITVVETILDTGHDAISFARIAGLFYNTQASGGAAGDIWAEVQIGDRGSGLEAFWEVEEALDDELDEWSIIGSGTIIGPGTLNYETAYTVKIAYDGNEGLEFTVAGETDSFSGPARQREAVTQNKQLSTGIDADGGSGIGYIHATFDNVSVNDASYDTFDDAPIDPTKWSSVEIAREISDGKLRLNIEGRGERVTNPLELTGSKTPYLETKVLVENGSHVSGNSGHVRLVALFYNDSRGPGSGKDYKGLKGDVFVTNRIRLNEDGSLVAIAGALRFDDVDGDIDTPLFWEEFFTQIDFNTEYTLSMEFTGSEIIFKCNDETLTYQLDTPAYPPSVNWRTIRSRMNSGGTGYIKAQIDDVYTIPSLRILAPNGGEVIPSGSVYNVRWAAPPKAETFKLKFSDDNGKTWGLLADRRTGTSYDADVYTPTKNKKNSLIKIIAYDASGKKVGKDKSDALFTVEVLSVTSPTEGDTLTSGETHTITWTKNGTKEDVETIKLLYTKNGGKKWIKIEPAPGPDDVSYDWTVPEVSKEKTKCKVKVVLKDVNGNTVGKATSDSYFRIEPLM